MDPIPSRRTRLALVERDPAPLAAIEADLDRHSLARNALRIAADARWRATRGLQLPSEDGTPTGASLEQRRLGGRGLRHLPVPDGIRVVRSGGSRGSRITWPEEGEREDHTTARDDRSAVESLKFTIKDGSHAATRMHRLSRSPHARTPALRRRNPTMVPAERHWTPPTGAAMAHRVTPTAVHRPLLGGGRTRFGEGLAKVLSNATLGPGTTAGMAVAAEPQTVDLWFEPDP